MRTLALENRAEISKDEANIATAFKNIYNENFKKLYGFIYGKIKNTEDTSDLVQTVFASFYKRYRLEGFPPGNECTKILYTYSRHQLYKYYGTRSIENMELSFDEEIADEKLHNLSKFVVPDKLSEDNTITDRIWEIIRSKGDITERIFTLHYSFNYTLKECAALMECSESFVTNRVYRTIKEIKAELVGGDDSDT